MYRGDRGKTHFIQVSLTYLINDSEIDYKWIDELLLIVSNTTLNYIKKRYSMVSARRCLK